MSAAVSCCDQYVPRLMEMLNDSPFLARLLQDPEKTTSSIPSARVGQEALKIGICYKIF